MRDVIRYSMRPNGITSLFQGYDVALLSVSMYRLVYLRGYDYTKAILCERHCLPIDSDASDLPFLERLLAAQVISMMASTFQYPLDSVRRRLMMHADSETKTYRNGIHCFMRIYKEEGVQEYFRGLGTNYIRSVGAALLLVSCDWFKTALS